jgi:hypothetical protein
VVGGGRNKSFSKPDRRAANEMKKVCISQQRFRNLFQLSKRHKKLFGLLQEYKNADSPP